MVSIYPKAEMGLRAVITAYVDGFGMRVSIYPKAEMGLRAKMHHKSSYSATMFQSTRRQRWV